MAAKSSTYAEIGSATQKVLDILHEINTHETFCQTFGITQEELESTPESTATTAYGGYMIDTGLRGMWRMTTSKGLVGLRLRACR